MTESPNPVILGLFRQFLAMLPANLPEEVALWLGTSLAHAGEEMWAKHLADPTFSPKMEAWVTQAQAAKGGTSDDKAKAAADLYDLIDS